jgi:type II secretory pathway component GspD/PulD (secretin)
MSYVIGYTIFNKQKGVIVVFEEYYVSNKPVVYPDVHIIEVLRELKLNYGMQYSVNPLVASTSAIDYEKHLKLQMTRQLAENILDTDKIEFKSYDSPVMGRTLVGETFIMTKQDVYNLLGKFGIYVKIHEKKL